MEKRHTERVKALACSLCDQSGPSEAHEIRQGQWFTSVALCASCHRGPLLGLHGQRQMWVLKKMDEIDALAITIRRVVGQMDGDE
jgi:hypothetical protein